jgi:hypothetical protein
VTCSACGAENEFPPERVQLMRSARGLRLLGSSLYVVGVRDSRSVTRHAHRDLRNHLPARTSDWTRLLLCAIHASAAASVAKLLTVVGYVPGMTISTAKAPLASGTMR